MIFRLASFPSSNLPCLSALTAVAPHPSDLYTTPRGHRGYEGHNDDDDKDEDSEDQANHTTQPYVGPPLDVLIQMSEEERARQVLRQQQQSQQQNTKEGVSKKKRGGNTTTGRRTSKSYIIPTEGGMSTWFSSSLYFTSISLSYFYSKLFIFTLLYLMSLLSLEYLSRFPRRCMEVAIG